MYIYMIQIYIYIIDSTSMHVHFFPCQDIPFLFRKIIIFFMLHILTINMYLCFTRILYLYFIPCHCIYFNCISGKITIIIVFIRAFFWWCIDIV